LAWSEIAPPSKEETMSDTYNLRHGLFGRVVASVDATFPYGEFPNLITGASPAWSFWQCVLRDKAIAARFPEHLLDECIVEVIENDSTLPAYWDEFGQLHRAAA
jgi:hypothetical protein